MNKPSIDHIGIAVRDLEEASVMFRKILGIEESHREEIADEGVLIAVFDLAGARIELISPLGEESPISAFLSSRGPGVHHIAVKEEHIQARHRKLLEGGFPVIGKIRRGGEGREVFFLHPKKTSGVLIEFTSPPSCGSDR